MNRTPPAPAGQREVLEALAQLLRTEGPARLFPSRAGDPGVVPRTTAGRMLLDTLLGGLAQEAPRSANQPRRAALTAEGVRFLVRHTPAAERPSLARAASALYQLPLLRAWRECAAPSEQGALQNAIADALGDLVDDGGADAFVEDRARQLVLTWSREASPSVRQGLARAMIGLGLRPLGEVGAEVDFEARLHDCAESVFPGDPVRVVEPGWVLDGADGELLLHRVTVEPVP